MSKEQAKKFANMLEDVECPLKSLDMSSNELNINVRSIFKSLVANKRLSKLFLRMNFLGEEGAKAICDVLDDNNSLTFVDLSSNHLQGEKLGRIINNALHTNQTITEFLLENNDLPLDVLGEIKEHLLNLRVEGRNITNQIIEEKFKMSHDLEHDVTSNLQGALLAHKYYVYCCSRLGKSRAGFGVGVTPEENLRKIFVKVKNNRNSYPFSELILSYLAEETLSNNNVQKTLLSAVKAMLEIELGVDGFVESFITNQFSSLSLASANGATNNDAAIASDAGSMKRHKSLFRNLCRLCSSTAKIEESNAWLIAVHEFSFDFLKRVAFRKTFEGKQFREPWIIEQCVKPEFVGMINSLQHAVNLLGGKDHHKNSTGEERRAYCIIVADSSAVLELFTREYDGSSARDSERVRSVLNLLTTGCVEAVCDGLNLYGRYTKMLGGLVWLNLLKVLVRMLRHGAATTLSAASAEGGELKIKSADAKKRRKRASGKQSFGSVIVGRCALALTRIVLIDESGDSLVKTTALHCLELCTSEAMFKSMLTQQLVVRVEGVRRGELKVERAATVIQAVFRMRRIRGKGTGASKPMRVKEEVKEEVEVVVEKVATSPVPRLTNHRVTRLIKNVIVPLTISTSSHRSGMCFLGYLLETLPAQEQEDLDASNATIACIGLRILKACAVGKAGRRAIGASSGALGRICATASFAYSQGKGWADVAEGALGLLRRLADEKENVRCFVVKAEGEEGVLGGLVRLLIEVLVAEGGGRSEFTAEIRVVENLLGTFYNLTKINDADCGCGEVREKIVEEVGARLDFCGLFENNENININNLPQHFARYTAVCLHATLLPLGKVNQSSPLSSSAAKRFATFNQNYKCGDLAPMVVLNFVHAHLRFLRASGVDSIYDKFVPGRQVLAKINKRSPYFTLARCSATGKKLVFEGGDEFFYKAKEMALQVEERYAGEVDGAYDLGVMLRGVSWSVGVGGEKEEEAFLDILTKIFSLVGMGEEEPYHEAVMSGVYGVLEAFCLHSKQRRQQQHPQPRGNVEKLKLLMNSALAWTHGTSIEQFALRPKSCEAGLRFLTAAAGLTDGLFEMLSEILFVEENMRNIFDVCELCGECSKIDTSAFQEAQMFREKWKGVEVGFDGEGEVGRGGGMLQAAGNMCIILFEGGVNVGGMEHLDELLLGCTRLIPSVLRGGLRAEEIKGVAMVWGEVVFHLLKGLLTKKITTDNDGERRKIRVGIVSGERSEPRARRARHNKCYGANYHLHSLNL